MNRGRQISLKEVTKHAEREGIGTETFAPC
jgi:hypothetical protein